MELTRCLCCGSEESVSAYTSPDRLLGGADTFTVVRCRRCGLHYLNPRPAGEETARYYPSDYVAWSGPARTAGSRLRRWDQGYGQRKRCQMVLRWQRAGRLVDVGCGSGDFLAAMFERSGWEVEGVEPGEWAAEHTARRLNRPVSRGRLEDAGFASGRFDVVTAWDVLEHLPDPRSTLREMNRVLRQGGVLVAGVPNADALNRRLFGSYWPGMDPPRHTHIPAADQLGVMLREAGFEVLQRTSLYGGYYCLSGSVDNWSKDSHSPWLAAVRAALRTPIARVLVAPLLFVLGKLGLGDNLTVAARKTRQVAI